MGVKESKVKDGNFYVVQSFMVKDLKLKGVEKDVYAIIYGFSQAENQVFNGSLQYLADWTCSSKQAVMNALKKLVSKNLINKNEIFNNGVKFVEYSATELTGIQENCMGINKKEDGIQETSIPPIQETLSNNIELYNIENNKEIDIIDKIDKREYSPISPNSFTKELINNDYIQEDDLSIQEYNNLFMDLINEYSFEIVRSCLWYFIKRYKVQGDYDEQGISIENKLAYFTTTMRNNVSNLDRMNNRETTGEVGSWLYN